MKKMNVLNYAMPQAEKKSDKKSEGIFGKEIEKFKEDPKAFFDNVKNMDFKVIFSEDNVKKFVNDAVKAAHEALDKFQEKLEEKEDPEPKAAKAEPKAKPAAKAAPKAKSAAKAAPKAKPAAKTASKAKPAAKDEKAE